MRELRPIGSRYFKCYAPTDEAYDDHIDNFRLVEYEVTGHVYIAWNNMGMVETINPIKQTYYPCLGWRRYCGFDIPIPPPEVLPYLTADWHEPQPVKTLQEVNT